MAAEKQETSLKQRLYENGIDKMEHLAKELEEDLKNLLQGEQPKMEEGFLETQEEIGKMEALATSLAEELIRLANGATRFERISLEEINALRKTLLQEILQTLSIDLTGYTQVTPGELVAGWKIVNQISG